MSRVKQRPARSDVGIRRVNRNACVYVARADWVEVLSGAKTEVRIYGNRNVVERDCPCPCVLYTPNPIIGLPPQTALGVLEEQWVEPLGAISPESLEREGFPDDLDGFRAYFAQRYPKGGFRPLAKVVVRRVHPMVDAGPWKDWLWDRLYGDFA